MIAVPIVLIARYALFRDKAEFALFFAGLKTFVAPLIIGFSIVAIGGLLYFASNKVDHARQMVVGRIFFWISSTILAAAFAAVFVNAKLTPTGQ
ncbi:hypothetical protein ABMA59_04205 [Mesorhizobium sp. CN2-181]